MKNIESVYPLSPMQQGMLFHALYKGHSADYFRRISCVLEGSLDERTFRAAWQQTVQRHTVLRTSFVWEALKEPVQVVHQELALPWIDLDWRASSPAEQDCGLKAFLQNDEKQGFDLSRPPLMRCALIRTSDVSWRFVWTLHHIVLDGWSMPLLLKEVFAIYEATLRGEDRQSTAPRKYRDYVLWVKQQNNAEAEAFWKNYLQGFAASTPVLTEPSVPLETTSLYAKHDLVLTEEQTSALRRCAERLHVTLSTLFHGTWAVLLSRYSGEQDIMFGATVSGRSATVPGIESMIGLLINTLPIRIKVDPAESISALLQRLQVLHANVREYEHSSLVDLQKWSAVPPGQPLFESIVVFENYPDVDYFHQHDGAIRIRDVDSVERTSFPLTLLVSSGKKLCISLLYDASRFDGEAIERASQHFNKLLFSMNDDNPVQSLTLLSAAERQTVLQKWNDTQADYPSIPIYRQIEERAAQVPDQVAVVFEERQLTYAQLNRSANQLAEFLRGRGVRPGILVGICVERSLEMVVGLLGIMKAGGAYVPFDPGYPKERLAFMVADAQVPLILTQDHLLSAMPEGSTTLICLDQDAQEIARCTYQNSAAGAELDDLAYVIYTSGSTGQPKGAMNTHRGLCNRLWWMQQAYQLKADDRVLQKTPFSFDVSVWEFFWPLLAGATLVVARPGGHQEPNYLVETICLRRITTLHFVPSMLRAFLQAAGVERCDSLRRVICSGEALSHDLEQQFFARQSAELHNLYGPTETAIDVTFWKCVRGSQVAQVPIGRPIANTQIYILDTVGNPVPIGVAGELHIGGVGVGKGYWMRPELTKEKFVPDPFSNDKSTRLYKTGDLARYRPDGAIEYLGRLDHQVKIRGFRIELGEIEAVLTSHPAIRECVVVAREDQPGEKRLVAYMTIREKAFAKISELRTYSLKKLPEYAVPSLFITLDAMPLAPNGKLDRRALPLPDEARPDLGASYVPPRTPVEQKLAEIWSQVLKLNRVGIYDNFFELGGDSILSIQITSRSNAAGLRIAARDLFKYPTISDLANIVNTTALIEVEQGAVEGAFPPTPIQSWFLEQNLKEPHHWNQGLLLCLRRPLDPTVLRRAIASLIEHHDALRIRFGLVQPHGSADCAPTEENLPFSIFDLSRLSEAEQKVALNERVTELQASLDLQHGPIIRVALFDFGTAKPGRLLILVHHLVVDGVSWRILLEDLEQACGQARRGEAIQLPRKTTSYREWACRLSDYAKIHEEEVSYWRGLDWNHVASFPTDFSGGLNTEESARSVTMSLDEAETQLLLQRVPEALHTQINDVLLTALGHACAVKMGGAVIPISVEGHGREELMGSVDLTRTVGWFTSLFPALLRVETGTGILNELKSVKEQLRSVPNRGIGFGVLKYLGREAVKESLRGLPQPLVAFNYLGQFDQVLCSDGEFHLAPEELLGFHSPRGTRCHLLEVTASVVSSRFQVSWIYSENFHRRSTIDELSGEFLNSLRAMIQLSQVTKDGAHTPSDFPLAEVNQKTVDELTFGQQIEDMYPLSSMQEGILFHSLNAPEAGMYFEQLSCRLEGPLNVLAFEKAWCEVLARHPALRTGFEWEKSEKPLQVVHRHVEMPFTYIDWSGFSAPEQQDRLEHFLKDDRRQGFELKRPPLMRVTVIQLGDDVCQFVWGWNHLLLDGWGLPLVLGQVFSGYARISGRGDLALQPARTARFADYIAWLRRQDIGKAERFWRQYLKGFLNPTQIGSDRSNGEPPSEADYAEQHSLLDIELTDRLKVFARRNQLTLNTLVQGAWAFLLSRHGGDADVVFGATVSGRPAEVPGVESMVGLFINTLPVRVCVNDEDTVVGWLGRLQDQQVELQDYAYTPLVKIQSCSELPPRLQMFTTILAFENHPVERIQDVTGGLEIRDVHIVERTNYPLNVTVSPGRSLAFRFSYDQRFFGTEEIRHLLAQFQQVLEEIVTKPAARVGDLCLLTAHERREILVEWNNTRSDYSKELSIARSVEVQAAERPEGLAVASSAKQLSYGELNRKANQLAHYLKEKGVGPETLVAICMERSVEMVVALVAILKAGGAYVPLDPAYPTERLAFMLEDAGASVLLTQAELAQKLLETTAKVICLDNEGEQIISRSTENLATSVEAHNLAYVIYTSGSTGKPKGVAVEHGGLLNLIRWHLRTYEVSEKDRATLLAAPAFDASVWELWPYLTAGASIHIPDEVTRSSPAALMQWLAMERITLTFLATPLAEAALEVEFPRNLCLKALLTGGDRLHRAPPAELPFRLMNHYGPTENTVVATCCEVRPYEEGLPPIGRPISNTRVYVLDKAKQPVPVGVAGELYIGGESLARGYHQRPELTAEKFVSNPFSSEEGDRIYKTGDLVRYRADGVLEFVGRVDDQVKIRGFRIELGEIEAILRSHPEVREAAVLAWEDTMGEKRLVAYIATQETEIAMLKLRSWMKAKLPEYMVPTAFVRLDSLPITPNGKVDRGVLPPPPAFDLATQYLAPRSRTEMELCVLWQDILKRCKVGIRDNFFDLGGHSLLAMRVTARCSESFRVTLPLASVFEYPTIEQLACLIDRILTHRDQELKPAIVPRSREAFRTKKHWSSKAVSGAND